MNLQGRDLKLDLSGDDVRQLQSELALLGLTVPDAEWQQANFGQGTLEAVIRLQKERGLDPTGVVDARTTKPSTRQWWLALRKCLGVDTSNGFSQLEQSS